MGLNTTEKGRPDPNRDRVQMLTRVRSLYNELNQASLFIQSHPNSRPEWGPFLQTAWELGELFEGYAEQDHIYDVTGVFQAYDENDRFRFVNRLLTTLSNIIHGFEDDFRLV